MNLLTLLSSFLSVAPLASALTLPTIPKRESSLYAPISADCPATLVRPAVGLNCDEATYLIRRKAIADVALKKWLMKTNKAFGNTTLAKLPTIALTTSGGGYRSLLLGAGVIQGLDARDSNVSTSGLFDAITYQAGLSGGAWLLSSFAGNNYPTITSLKEDLWKDAFQNSLLVPSFLFASNAYAKVIVDIQAKQAAGFLPTLTDPWGRLLAYQLLQGDDGGAAKTFSGVTTLSNFTSYNVPYPIITALGVKTWLGECIPGPNATTYEFTPYEFGSWDSDVSAFTPTAYLGSSLSGGVPTTSNVCVKNYDNLGYVLGTSSNIYNQYCTYVPEPVNSTSSLANNLATMVNTAHEVTSGDEFSVYPNPFYKYQSSSSTFNSANDVAGQKDLDLVDGGGALQNNPIFPLLQAARGVDVLLVNDNSADSNNFPNGSEILTTYVQSFNHNLTRMPFIPSVETFVAEGLNTRATFFGCNATDKITIVYIPNTAYTYQSNVATAQLQYEKNETDSMVANGVQMISQGGDAAWGTCLGCAIMSKSGATLPSECQACFNKYCYNGS
jgi:lysophospholipase